MLRPRDLVELVIRHAGFSVRLCDGRRAVVAAPTAAEGFRAVVDVADASFFAAPTIHVLDATADTATEVVRFGAIEGAARVKI